MFIYRIAVPENYNTEIAERALKYLSKRYFSKIISKQNNSYRSIRERFENIYPDVNINDMLNSIFNNLSINKNGDIILKNKRYLDRDISV